MSIIAPTQGDAATSCFYGPSGVRAHNPDARLITTHGGTVIRWPNGAEAKLFGANNPEDVERLRSGGNRCCVWMEELAAWRHLQDCWNHMRFGLRLGPRPHFVASTTPKAKKLIKQLATGLIKGVVSTHAVTDDNPYLQAHVREMLYDTYHGTTLGAQELLGRIIEEDQNALWTRNVIEQYRLVSLDSITAAMQRVTVGVDPSGGAGEQGIVVLGKGLIDINSLPHGYVIDDRTCRKSPDGWGRQAVQAAIDWEADDIAVEVNFGGDMAVSTIRNAADAMGISIPIKKLTASRGKRPRAEPTSAVAAQGRLHHVGVFEELEDQLCTWTPEADYSPDRLDAMVWASWQTKLVSLRTTKQGGSYAGQMMSQYRIG
jgi:phage terminase large subunit-like protein